MKMETEVDDFENTFTWALEEEKNRTTRGEAVGTFYLILISLFILGVFTLILYFSNKKPDLTALEMIQDPNNVYDDEFSNADEEVEEN